MDEHKHEFSIVKMSEVLEVSRSGYYRWRPTCWAVTFSPSGWGQVWVSDITYLPSSGGWLYLTTTRGPGRPANRRLVAGR